MWSEWPELAGDGSRGMAWSGMPQLLCTSPTVDYVCHFHGSHHAPNGRWC